MDVVTTSGRSFEWYCGQSASTFPVKSIRDLADYKSASTHLLRLRQRRDWPTHLPLSTLVDLHLQDRGKAVRINCNSLSYLQNHHSYICQQLHSASHSLVDERIDFRHLQAKTVMHCTTLNVLVSVL